MRKRIFVLDHMLAISVSGLFAIGLYNRLLFHHLAEMFRISVAMAIFMLVWNVRRSLDNAYLIIVSVALVFASGLDLLHTIASEGMSIFRSPEKDLAAQLWIAARYMEATAFLAAPFFLGRKVKMRWGIAACAAASGLFLGTIIVWPAFPSALGEGFAPTPFLITSEVAVLLILAAALFNVARKRRYFDPAVLRFLTAAIGFAFLSELCLSFQKEAASVPFLLGHLLKIISFYYIYKAIIEMGLAKPLSVLFRSLKASEDALLIERNLMDAVFSSEDVIVAVLDRKGRVVRFNKAAERTTGYTLEEMRRREPWNLILPERPEEMIAVLQETVSTGLPGRRELRLLSKNGTPFWVLWSVHSILDKTGKVEYLVISGIDISERKKAEEALRQMHDQLDLQVQERTKDLDATNVRLQREVEKRRRIEEALLQSEKKYRAVADNTYDWEWWRDQEGRFIYSSPSCWRITGHAADEFSTDPDLLIRIIHPDDRAFFLRHNTEVEQKAETGEIEFRILRPDGTIRWLAHACQPMLDESGQPLGRRGSNRDITPRKEAEEALQKSEQQLRQLSAQILTAQELERRRISRELHDELGGALAVLKLRTSFIEKNLPGRRAELKEAGKQSLDDIDRLIDNLSRLSRDLSPSILEDLGLTPALRWLVGHFVKNYKVEADVEIPDLGGLFPKDSQIMIYRIIQEGLTNIGKHARATKVSIRVEEADLSMTFLIEDDGCGFDPETAAAKDPLEKGLGLATMRERARMLGGSFDLMSEPGRGTRIVLKIPVEGEKGG